MRKLFPIPLMGRGTPEVESFGSYIHRIAYEHGVYVGELLRFVYREAVDAGVRNGDHALLPNSFDISEAIRGNQLTSTLVYFFEWATGQALESGTFIKLNGAVGRSAGAIVKGFQWCPECLQNDINSGRSPYYRLAWHFPVGICSIHRAPLIEHCEYCGCNQRSFERKRSLGYCQKCERPLSFRKERLNRKDIVHSWEVPSTDLQELLADLTSEPPMVLCHRGIRESLERLLHQYGVVDKERDFYALLSREEIRAIIYEERPISLKLVRRLSFRLGISIVDLLSGNACCTTESLDSAWARELPSDFKVAKKPRPRKHVEVLNHVHKIISCSDEPPSMKEVARSANVSLGYLAYRHPALMKEIAIKREAYRQEMQRQKLQLAKKSALSFFVDEKYRLHQKSRKEAYRVLHAETGLPKFMLKDAIQAVYSALT